MTQQFSVSAERVFDAWLDPARIGRWMFGPAVREEEVVHIEVDARVDGRFSFRVRRGEGEIDHDISHVRVDIVPQGSTCTLTLTHEMDAKWAEYAARARDAWAKMIGVLAGGLAP